MNKLKETCNGDMKEKVLADKVYQRRNYQTWAFSNEDFKWANGGSNVHKDVKYMPWRSFSWNELNGGNDI